MNSYWHAAKMAHRRLIMGSHDPQADNEVIDAALIRGSTAEQVVELAGRVLALAFIDGSDLTAALSALKEGVTAFQDLKQEGPAHQL